MASAAPAYSPIEELIHALTAGLGIIACAVAIPWLAWVSAGDAARMVAALVFGASALAMFVTSVVYHAARAPELKLVLRKFDHAAIYLLIAGTYTPITLVAMRNTWGWVLFGAIWALAVFGIVAKTAVGFRFPKLSVFLYLAMGWLCIIAIRPVADSLTSTELAWVIAGGVVYTAGVPFYVWKSRRYTHAVWHLFVLGGVACHFAAVLSVVSAPAG
ncbi:MAG TPA: hemolysin III family protein [Steroidobacteraceae bacterium]|jgi:hemolysin III|nr:hemolysin III family protein [Steroidobacteraceae bacterium]